MTTAIIESRTSHQFYNSYLAILTQYEGNPEAAEAIKKASALVFHSLLKTRGMTHKDGLQQTKQIIAHHKDQPVLKEAIKEAVSLTVSFVESVLKEGLAEAQEAGISTADGIEAQLFIKYQAISTDTAAEVSA